MAGLIAVYNDELMKLFEGYEMQIKRASHVEPIEVDGVVRWQADMGPVGGPILKPFATRQEALDAEKVWLEANIIKPDSDAFNQTDHKEQQA